MDRIIHCKRLWGQARLTQRSHREPAVTISAVCLRGPTYGCSTTDDELCLQWMLLLLARREERPQTSMCWACTTNVWHNTATATGQNNACQVACALCSTRCCIACCCAQVPGQFVGVRTPKQDEAANGLADNEHLYTIACSPYESRRDSAYIGGSIIEVRSFPRNSLRRLLMVPCAG